MALMGTIQSDDNGNQILFITICKYDFNVIQDNADIISIVVDSQAKLDIAKTKEFGFTTL